MDTSFAYTGARAGYTMLRLRIIHTVPQSVKPGDTIRFSISCTNESGALQKLGPGAKLCSAEFEGVDLLDGGKLEFSPSGEGALSITIAAGKFDNRLVRIKLTPASEWPLIPASVKDERGTSRTTGSAQQQFALVPVCPLLSPAIMVSKSPDSPLPSDDVSLSSCIVQFPSPSTGTLRIYECQSAVSAGFGSIVWDCALAVLHAMGAGSGQGVGTGKGKSAPVQGPACLSSYLPTRPGTTGLGAGGRHSTQSRGGAAQRHTPWKGLRVVDLGCGTGVLGIAAGSLGATVACTDLPSMLPLTWANVKANAGLIKAGGGTVTCVPLLWGGQGSEDGAAIPLDGLHAEAVQSILGPLPLPAGAPSSGPESGEGAMKGTGGKKRILPAQLDGLLLAESPASLSMRCPVDVVIASEVAYRPEAFEPLLHTFALLTGASIHTGDGEGEGPPAAGGAGIAEDALRPSASCPVLILAARRRACMDLCDFLALLRPSFHVLAIAGVREGWRGSEEDWASLTGTPSEKDCPASTASLSSPDPLQAFVSRASLLSKTGWPPMLFIAWPKRRRTVGGGSSG